jgi:hypothetical protein
MSDNILVSSSSMINKVFTVLNTAILYTNDGLILVFIRKNQVSKYKYDTFLSRGKCAFVLQIIGSVISQARQYGGMMPDLSHV